MKMILIIWAGFFSAYLYMDKFVFRGQLGTLFRRGWCQLLGGWLAPFRRWKPHHKQIIPENTLLPQEPVESLSDDNLVVRKRYVSGQRVPAGDIGPKSESTAADNNTFAPATKADAEPEVLEWRAPSFQKKEAPKPPRKVPPPRWEDEDFAMTTTVVHNEESGEEEIVQVPDSEQIRREVAARLEAIEDAEILAAIVASEAEKYDVEHFETSTYR